MAKKSERPGAYGAVPQTKKAFAKVARTSAALLIRGRLQRAEGVTSLLADHLAPLSLRIKTTSRDFR
jgi:error-prone DNA polymerase